MSWSDPCSNCGEHRADCECEDYNGMKQSFYKKYVEEWERRYVVNNNSPDWSISNNIGDPYSYKEWLDKPSLRNI